MTPAAFRPAWWLPSPHLQTIWPTLLRRGLRVEARSERLELPDGDFVDLAWVGPDSGPIVVVLHGLEGSLRSPYARGILRAIAARGWRGVLMHFRGCSGEPNRLPRGYHSGDTGDIAYLVETLRARAPATPIAAVGYSLGGNALLKWLGELGSDNPLIAAVAVSAPFELASAAARLERGISRLYQAWLLRHSRQAVLRKVRLGILPPSFRDVGRLRTFRAFDDRVTAPLHGFAGVDDYYARASSRQYLGEIRAPALILHARDDPFLTPAAIPARCELSPSVHLELSDHGGHVGFITGVLPGRARYWLDGRIMAFLGEHLPRP